MNKLVTSLAVGAVVKTAPVAATADGQGVVIASCDVRT